MTKSESLHEALRHATRASHEALDASFGSLDMMEEADFRRFLAAHFIGVVPLFPLYRAFVTEELGIAAPDFPEMLRADLAGLESSSAVLPAIALPQPVDPVGVTYVLAGSRLGLAMIRKRGYWAREGGQASAYMEDGDGIAVWRALTAWMADQTPAPKALDDISASATLAFDVFRQAFALSEVGAVS
jgi:heme oxygenase